jgi:hypothetical protein
LKDSELEECMPIYLAKMIYEALNASSSLTIRDACVNISSPSLTMDNWITVKKLITFYPQLNQFGLKTPAICSDFNSSDLI